MPLHGRTRACFQHGHSDLPAVLYRRSTVCVFLNCLTALPRLSATVWKNFLMRTVLSVVQQCLHWAKLKVKPSKSRVLYLKASTGKAFSPQLSIGGRSMEHIGTSSFKFLGMQIQVPPNSSTARNDLKHSVEQMLRAIDAVPVTSH